MPPKKKKKATKPKMFVVQGGKGWLGDAAKWLGRQAVNVVKNVKPSQVLGLLPDGRAQVASQVARTVGLGKKRRIRRRRPLFHGTAFSTDIDRLGSGAVGGRRKVIIV